MEDFFAAALRPFLLVLLLVAAKFFASFVVRCIPEGKFKDYVTKPRSNNSEMMNRADAAVGRFFMRIFRTLFRLRRP